MNWEFDFWPSRRFPEFGRPLRNAVLADKREVKIARGQLAASKRRRTKNVTSFQKFKEIPEVVKLDKRSASYAAIF